MNRRRITLPSSGLNFSTMSMVWCMLVAVLIATPEKLTSSPVPNQKDLTFAFFRVVDALSNERVKFQSIRISNRGRSFVIYTEQASSLKISTNKINFITLGKEQIGGLNAGNQEREIMGKSSQLRKEDDKAVQKDGYVYKATFSLAKTEIKRFQDFAKANEGARFDFRFGDNRLGIIQFIGPFGSGSDFTTFLDEAGPSNLKEIFEPIKNKVIWK